jgi:hypothetical protein
MSTNVSKFASWWGGGQEKKKQGKKSDTSMDKV